MVSAAVTSVLDDRPTPGAPPAPPTARAPPPSGGTSRWITARTSVGPSTREPHAEALERPPAELLAGEAGAAHVEDHDVGLDPVGVDRDAGQLRQPARQTPRALVVLGQAVDVVLQRVDPGGRDDARLAHRAAEALLEDPGLLDERARARQHGADRRAEALGQVEPHAVERRARRRAPASRSPPPRSSAGRRPCDRPAPPRGRPRTPPRSAPAASRRRPRCWPSARPRAPASAACSAPGGRTACRTCSAVKSPRAPGSGRITAPTIAAGPPAS